MDDRDLLALTRGQLPAESADEVERHLARCADCRSLLAELAVTPSPALEAAVERTFPQAGTRTPSESRRSNRLIRWGSAIGAIAAAAAVTFSLGTRPTGTRNEHPDFDWVAAYGAAPIEGGVQAVRSTNLPESLRFQPVSPLKWAIRAVDGVAVSSATVFVGPRGGTLQPAKASVTRGPDGTFLVEGDAAEVLGPAFGDKILAVAVGPMPLDLAGRPADAPTLAAGEAGVVFTKALVYDPEAAR